VVTQARTILVVDDVPMFRELGSVFLARTGTVVTAPGGEAALELAQRLKPDLVVTDLHMPGMDGEQLCRALKSDPVLAETPVIVMLGRGEPEERGRAVRAGADDLLQKPLSRLALVRAVDRFLRYPEVRGLPRVDVEQPAELTADDCTTAGVVRNLSRGGAFVETERRIASHREVRLRFALPRTDTRVEPSAQVIWHRPADDGPSGMGMRFVELDGATERWLEDYVWEHTLTDRRRPLAPTGTDPR